MTLASLDKATQYAWVEDVWDRHERRHAPGPPHVDGRGVNDGIEIDGFHHQRPMPVGRQLF